MKILLCITVYNEIEITEKCLKVIKQNYPNRHLLIDDYSQKDIMKSLVRKFNVFYISKKVNHPKLTKLESWI